MIARFAIMRLSSGAAQFLQKPIAFADLLRQMRRFVDVKERATEPNDECVTAIGKEPDASNRIERIDLGSRGAR